MQFTCDKLMLLAAIITSSRATASKSPVVLLEGLLLETDEDSIRISGYDLKTGIITTVPADIEKTGAIVLNARLFSEIIRKMPGNEISITVSANFVATIKSDMSLFEIIGSPSSDYPELPSVDGQDTFEVCEEVMKKMISQTIFAVSDNESRPIQTGALFETNKDILTIVASDGYRLALRCESINNEALPNLSFVVPGTALNELEKIASDGKEMMSVTLGSKHILFNIGDTILISRRLEGEFLNYKYSIPQSSKYNLKINKNDFIASVERVSLIINDNLKSPVRCVFSDGIIKLSSASAIGKANDECEIDGYAEDIEVGFNHKYLVDALKAAPAEIVMLELNSGVNPCIIKPADEGGNFLYMVLPVRLKSYES